MTLMEYYEYSWFANLSYVNWDPEAVGTNFDPNIAILNANATDVERVPGSTSDSAINTLGEKIFIEEGWRVADFHGEDDPITGFAASLFINEGTGEKVLGIRGTDPGGDGQITLDLLKADFLEIGFIGMALSQTVSMFNYIKRLQADTANKNVLRLELKTGFFPPDGVNSIEAIPGVRIWFEAHHDAEGLELIDNTDNITITGHSLGGHLAAIGQRLFPTLFDQTITYNAPGFNPDTADTVTPALAALLLPGPFKLLAFLLDESALQLTNPIISQLFEPHLPFDEPPASGFGGLPIISLASEDVVPGNDPSGVASLLTGIPFSARQFIATERDSHLIEPFMDELAVQALIEQLDPDIGIEGAEILYQGASNDAGKSGESLLDALSNLLLENKPPLLPENENDIADGADLFLGKGDLDKRAAIHTRVIELEQKIEETPGLTLESIVEKTKDDLFTLSQDPNRGLAFRYALVNLNPFVIESISAQADAELYLPHNQNDELELENFSDEYLADRSAFLRLLLQSNIEDDEDIDIDLGAKYDGARFIDVSKEIEITNKASIFSTENRFIFGTEQSEGRTVFNTSSTDDHVYGGGGIDTIFGGGGDDYIEGNADNDSLHGEDGEDILVGGAGNDSLSGSDIFFERNQIENTTFPVTADDTYSGGTGEDFIIDSWGNDTMLGGADSDFIAGGSDGDTILGGDGDDILYGDEVFGGNTITREWSITLDSEGRANGFNSTDIFSLGTGTRPGDDFIDGGAGNDYIIAGMGDDIAYGGAGNDQIQGDEGDDFIDGGAGKDLIFGGEDNDTLFGGSEDDELQGGEGDDFLDGGAGEGTWKFRERPYDGTIDRWSKAA